MKRPELSTEERATLIWDKAVAASDRDKKIGRREWVMVTDIDKEMRELSGEVASRVMNRPYDPDWEMKWEKRKMEIKKCGNKICLL